MIGILTISRHVFEDSTDYDSCGDVVVKRFCQTLKLIFETRLRPIFSIVGSAVASNPIETAWSFLLHRIMTKNCASAVDRFNRDINLVDAFDGFLRRWGQDPKKTCHDDPTILVHVRTILLSKYYKFLKEPITNKKK